MYLGKIIEEKGKHKEDIKERMIKGNAAAIISTSIVNEKNLTNKRIEVGLKLLQSVIIPTIISGAETWTKLTKTEEEEINNIQTQFLTRLLKVPGSTPKCALLKEMGLMKVMHVANQRKIEYYMELHNREEGRLEVKMRIHQEKKAMSYEKEIEELKKFYNIREDLKRIEAKEGKKRIKQYVIKKNKEEIEEEMKKGKKAKDLNECNKEYMSKLNFNEARMIFLLKSNMIETKANFKGQFINNLKCEICGKEENTQHLFECEGYTDIRKNIRIEDTPMKTLRRNNIKTIAEVLNKITEKRRRIMEEKNKPVAKVKTKGKGNSEKGKNTLKNSPFLCSGDAE